MKWLSGSLAFFNAATILGLLAGIMAHGLSRPLATFCIVAAFVIGYFAYRTTPDNPIEPFSKLRYPAGVDLFNALLSCLGIDVIRGLVWVGLIASIATFYAFYRWGGNFGIAAFLFNGGLASFPVLFTFKFLDYQ